MHMGPPGPGYPPPLGGYFPPPPVIQPVVVVPGMGGFGFGSSHCMLCQRPTESIPRKTLGCTAITWIVILLMTVPIISCIPCCTDGCKDT